MSREVRRVPLGWQHPTEWREQWDRAEGGVRMQCLPRPLFGQESRRRKPGPGCPRKVREVAP